MTAILARMVRMARRWIQAPPLLDETAASEAPLRAELFSAEQMAQHGRTLAQQHRLAPGKSRDRLLDRLAANAEILDDTCELLSGALQSGLDVSPAGDWLLDNHYLIDEQIHTAQRHFPKGYSWQLPRLQGSASDDLPRVYDIALEAIAHGDGRVDQDSLARFVAAYQEITALNLGELWAIPIMLRLALIENLRRVSVRIASDRIHRNLAENWADRMVSTVQADPKSLILVVADMARSDPPMSSSFVAELTRRLQGHGAALALPLTWIEQRLAEAGLTTEQLIHVEHQQQAAEQVSISNSIGSLRLLAVTDWREFVEAMSATERLLRTDPADVYARMDFASRDDCRHAIERIARASDGNELEVASRCLQLARDAANSLGTQAIEAHVGYYLFGGGYARLATASGMRVSFAELRRRGNCRFPIGLYLGIIGAVTVAVAGAMLWRAPERGLQDGLLILAALLSVVVASQFAVTVMNWLAAAIADPQPLPRMDYSTGIPAAARTLVVVPTLLGSVDDAADLAEALEVRFLANRDEHLHFALLTDFPDAQTPSMPDDDAILARAQAAITDLNARYAPESADRFFLLHRARRWCAGESAFMGTERKRGKLADLNALLRGTGQHFERIVGDTKVLRDIRYVITLDTDTQLPRDSARRFIGTMAHPLNRPQLDQSRGRVCAGYGILQPRVSTSLPDAGSSRYAEMFGGEPGFDPYTRAVSDAYQDLFGEGSFIGKGIYDVDAFEVTMAERFPVNRILSHDLLEGCYARAGMVSDVELYESYPSRYLADASRRHRWIRGDWQLASWLRRRVPGPAGRLENPLGWLAQWKIFDNLRRSLVAPASLALLLLGWTVLGRPLYWTGVVLVILLLPTCVDILLLLANKPAEAPLVHHLANVAKIAGRRSAQAVFNLACLPFEAALSLDAILRTQWRMHVSQRYLLQWTPSAIAERQAATTLPATLRSMWIAPAMAIGTALALLQLRPQALVPATAVLLLWLLAPTYAWWLSRPAAESQRALSAADHAFVGRLARRTWAFFERYVGAEDNFLPPDNFQESPVATLAHRTSPTNIGLALLANLAAYDLAYLGVDGLIERCRGTFDTLQKLPRYRGHFHNWIDTRSLASLLPVYISTVDSGNLTGHLLTLRQGLLQACEEPLLSTRILQALAETIANIETPAAETPAQKDLRKRLAEGPAALHSPRALHAELRAIAAAADEIARNDSGDAQRDFWQQALARQAREALAALDTYAPWLGTPAPARCASLLDALPMPDLETTAAGSGDWLVRMEASLDPAADAAEQAWLHDTRERMSDASRAARDACEALQRLAAQAESFAEADYGFLYDATRHLFSIGYNVTEHRRDNSYYDLLASEARLACFVAIARGQISQENWFALGRLLTQSGGEPVLLSWTGSMFEYLMPSLVMPSFPGTLLDATCRAAVRRQIAYGRQHDVPWGISESGYNLTDAALNYQYRAFGVPGLGLRRGLAEDLVIAPYACMLALVVTPHEACANLRDMAQRGWCGESGFFEAIDFTPARLRRGQDHAVVRSYMAHHQGMSLLAMDHLLMQRPMQRRFERDAQFQATMLLLQERVPKASSYHSANPERVDLRSPSVAPQVPVRVFGNADSVLPAVQLLSNGRYHLMLTSAGGGYSRCRDIALTRWHEDSTRDNWGTFLYVREVDNDICWSVGLQPMPREDVSYEAVFTEARVEYRRRSRDLETSTEIVVSPEDDIELRRTRLTNRSRQRRVIEITSYAEVVLAPAIADALHPAFSKLFVQTEIVHGREAILCTRRPRSAQEQLPVMFHLLALHDVDSAAISYETDRARFLGRGREADRPQAMRQAGPLSNSQGSVLDPIVAIRHRLVLEPEQSATVDLVTGLAASREACLALMEKYQDRRLADRVFDLAWTHSQVVLRQINVSDASAQWYGRLAASLIYAHSSLRAEASLIGKNRRGQSGLWGYAISGDLPIVLLQVRDPARIDLVRELVQAHAYWRLKGLSVDLVIWNEERGGYRQQLHDEIMGLIAAGIESHLLDRPGGIFVRNAEQIPQEDRLLMLAVARAVISDTRGTLAEQVRRRENVDIAIPRLVPARSRADAAAGDRLPVLVPVTAPAPARVLDNGIGGFSADGSEYIIVTDAQQRTPVPWCNVLANRDFGCVVSESGGGYTWKDNAHEFRLTPWDNDPVRDSGGEAFYLRDEESGRYWSPTPLPASGRGSYTTRHGFGYSVFEHIEDGIESELWIYVAPNDPVKFWKMRIRNLSGRARRLSVTGYIEWVLGDLRAKCAMHVVTELDPESGALFARNAYSAEFANQVAFFDVDEPTRTLSGDRGEFIGRNGSLREPAAMSRMRLSGRIGAAMDPCAAIQMPCDLGDGQSREIIFRLGVGNDAAQASALVQRFRRSGTARTSLDAIRREWTLNLAGLRVSTPDPSLDMLANGWLLYQVTACRLWARSGYYQSGGAFGFRDQLQDAMAVVHERPELLRAQLMLAASRQFREGDVQHWWHPPAGRGVRTQCSDDYLWLPYATCRYLTTTADAAILHENAAYLEGRALNHAEDSYYDLPIRSDENGSLYQHCTRAIEHGLRYGAHGLPLIGGGDWNDGMSHVGIEGRGESVWLGFFLYRVLQLFIPIARSEGDAGFADRCEREAATLRDNLEKHGWDGAWYRRAYFDDGTPLGSATNTECRIDAIAQSWSVLSGAASTERGNAALDALDTHLVRDEANLVQLLDPPFDISDPDPGYIRGYVPGVRENGGQYTHAAVWAAMAFAEAGRHERAWELLAMINPLRHALTPADVEQYKVEPYVVAADVYAVAPHTGRGGWTWYTGSAGWMYRLIIESLLGIHREGERLRLAPRLPAAWPGFSFEYRAGLSVYAVEVVRAASGVASSLTVDDVSQTDSSFALVDDGAKHRVVLTVG